MQLQEAVWMLAEDNLGRQNGEYQARRKLAVLNQLLGEMRARSAEAEAKNEGLQQKVEIQEGLIQSLREVIALADGAQGSLEESASILHNQNELLKERIQLDVNLRALQREELRHRKALSRAKAKARKRGDLEM